MKPKKTKTFPIKLVKLMNGENVVAAVEAHWFYLVLHSPKKIFDVWNPDTKMTNVTVADWMPYVDNGLNGVTITWRNVLAVLDIQQPILTCYYDLIPNKEETRQFKKTEYSGRGNGALAHLYDFLLANVRTDLVH